MIRDPRSVLASFQAYTYAPPPKYLGAIFNCCDAMLHAQWLAEHLPPERFLLVRYEDAARSPRATAEAMYRFLGLDSSLADFSMQNLTDAYGKPWRVNSSFHEGPAAFDVEAAINRWRGTLSDLEVALTETVCSIGMKAFDYDVSGAELDWPEALRLVLGDPDLTSALRHWLDSGEGIQAFPTDPVDSANWEENKSEE